MKSLTNFSLIILVLIFTFSCDKNTNKKNVKVEVEEQVVNDNSKKKYEIKLIDIPIKTELETERYEIDENIIVINIFKANIAMNKGVHILQKMFVNAKISNANSSEVFDAFNIVVNDKKYCGISVYKQNENEEFVIDKFFISKGLFSDKILSKIFF